MIIIDLIPEEIEEEAPWAMLFANDLVLGDNDREIMEFRLDIWIQCMEKTLSSRIITDNRGHSPGQDEEVCTRKRKRSTFQQRSHLNVLGQR